jgi:RNA recognition motif-containing protein
MASNDMNICNGFSTYRSSNVITNDEMSSTPQDPRMYKSKEKSITDAARAADHARRMKERLNRFQNDPRSTTLPQIVRPGNEEWLACSRTPSKYNRHLLRVENLRTQFTPVAVSHNGNRIKNIITKTHGDDEPLGTRKKPTSITLTEFESVGTVSSETNDLEPTASLSVSNSSGDISSETLVQTPALNQLKDSSVGGVDVTSFINCHSPDVSATGLSLMSVFNIEKEYAVNVQKALAGREKETTDLEGTKGLISQSSVTQIKVGSETVTSEVSTDVGIPHQIPNLDDIDDFSPQPMVIVSDNESNDAIPCALPSSSPITSEEEDHFMFTTSPEDNVESHAAADDNSGKLPKNTCLSLKIEIDELPHAGQIEDPHVTTREKLSSKGSDSGKGSSPKQCTECFRCLNKSRTKKGKSSNKKKKKNEKSRSWHRQKDFYPNSTSSDDEEQPRGRRYKTTDLSQGRSPPIRRSSFNRSCSRSRRSPSRELRTSGSSSRHKFSIRETRRMTLKYATQHDTSKTHEKCGWEQIDPDRPVFVHPQRMRKTGITDDLQIERETRKRSWDGLHPVSDAFDLPDKDPRVNKTLYIGNLDPSVSEEELKALFEEYGKVMLLFIKKFEAKKVYGFVKFQNLFESYRAKTHLHNKRLGKHRLNIGYARLVPSNRLWLGNLPKDLDSMFIYRELDRFGSITEMRHFRQDGEIDVTYESTAAAQVARNDMRGVILAKKEEFDNNGALTNKGTPHSEDPLLGKIRGIVTDFNEEAFKVVQTSDGSFSKRIRFNKDFENQDSSETQVVWQSCYISNGAQE